MRRILMSLLACLPFTPWWLARQEERERRALRLHVSRYYGA